MTGSSGSVEKLGSVRREGSRILYVRQNFGITGHVLYRDRMYLGLIESPACRGL